MATLTGTTYQQVLQAIENYYGSGSDQWVQFERYGLAAENAETILSQVPGVNLVKNADGTLRTYTYNAFSSSNKGVATAINSNVKTAVSTTVKVPAEMGVVEGSTELTLRSGLATAGNFVMKEVVPAVAAAGAGIALGKTIDSLLYNANPDFWDENGLGAINPETWNTITAEDDSTGARLFNMVFGIDPETEETQGYIDQNALAYLAYYLQTRGGFETDISNGDNEDYNNQEYDLFYNNYYNPPIMVKTAPYYRFSNGKYTIVELSTQNAYTAIFKGSSYFEGITISTEPFTAISTTYNSDGSIDSQGEGTGVETIAKNGDTFYYSVTMRERYDENTITSPPANTVNDSLYSVLPAQIANDIYMFTYGGTISGGSAVPGISDQIGATIPDLSDVTSVEETLTALQNQLPDLFNNAITQNVVQPDGSTTTYTYIPVGIPEGTGANDTQPVSGNSTQADMKVNPETSTESLIDLITGLINDTPVNPPDTGEGVTPAIVVPVGSAGALYKVYNPTNDQINTFGGWLWSSDFVDQLLKLFNDPMQAIIGLHKVFATPSVGGTTTIKVGYLDSGVSSNYIDEQYTVVNCGSIDLDEYFGNVFDYDPFTDIKLYLPFIGIVSLDTDDIMRATISIKYTVDVLSGACIAEVSVTRDGGAGGVLYTYSGNCAVSYPLSSGSYMGIVASVIGIAGSIAGTVATGGSLAPLALGAATGILNSHTRVEHSGSISGNSGAMGCKKPYLIIKRPQTHLAANVNAFVGKPANDYHILSSLSGFVRALEIHVTNTSATDNEKREIESLLKSGVIL